MITLNIEKRESKGTKFNNKLRNEGKVPGVCYGSGVESTMVTIGTKDITKAWETAGSATVIEVDGVVGKKNALIHDIEKDPVSDKIIHFDLLFVSKDTKVKVDVPLVFEGESKAIKELGGVLVQVHHSLEIEAIPSKLIQEIKVDLSLLQEIPSHITVAELKVPEGVEIKENADTIVASVVEAKEENLEEEAAEIDMDAIEVESKGKENKAGEEDKGEAK